MKEKKNKAAKAKNLENKKQVKATKAENQSAEPVKTKAAKKIKKQVETTLVEEVVSKREVKYLYPEDCNDTLSRKKYRQKVRGKLKNLELELSRIEDKNSEAFKSKKKELEDARRENLKVAI